MKGETKPVKRVELSYHTYYSTMDGIHSPEEWINIARRNDIRAFAITDFQDIFAFWKATLAVENLRRKEGPEEFDFKMLYGLETVLEDGSLIHLLVQNQAGLEQLFRLLEIAWQEREQQIRKELEHREDFSETIEKLQRRIKQLNRQLGV